MKMFVLCLALSIAAFASGAAEAASPACASARLQVETSHLQRVQACTAQGPNSSACLQSQQVENLQWQMMDAVCPAPAPQCSVQRQLYNSISARRALKCQQAGTSADPVCQAAMQQEQLSFLQVKVNCFQD